MARLLGLHRQGWVNVTRSDVLDTELASADEVKAAELMTMSSEYVEELGPLVLDHSRLDHAVLASDDDGERLHAVFGGQATPLQGC